MEIKLNLIPEYKKKEIAQSNLLKLILRWEIEIGFILIGFFVLLLSLSQVLRISFDSQTGEIEGNRNKDRYERISSLDKEFKTINSQLSLDRSIQRDQLYWSKMFEKLEEHIPEEVSVSRLANKDYKIFLVGSAATRDDLVRMKDSFSQEECFENVNLPLSNLVSRDNVVFQIEFDIKEECIKNK